jgi:hypothetical protein
VARQELERKNRTRSASGIRNDFSNQLVGIWRVSPNPRHPEPGLYLWTLTCTNCGVVVERITEHVPKWKRCRRCLGLPQGTNGLRYLFRRYRAKAAKMKRSFELTLEQFRSITSSHCFYCGQPPQAVSWGGQKYIDNTWSCYHFNGVDRWDNSKGYTQENTVPACEVCNRAKHQMSATDFIAYIRTFAENAVAGTIPCLQAPVAPSSGLSG